MGYFKRYYSKTNKVIIYGSGLFTSFFLLIIGLGYYGISITTSGDIICGDTCISYFNITTKNTSLCFGNTFSGPYLEGNASYELFKADMRYGQNNPNRWKLYNLTNKCLDKGKTIEFMLKGHKKPTDTVKWGVSYLGVDKDPLWIKTQNYTIEGNTAYINDSNAYLSATPHTISDSGFVTFNLSTKNYSGDIDIYYGYNSNNAHPTSSELYNPHNETIQKSYTCNSPNWYNYTANHFWCWNDYSNPIYNNNTGKIIGWDNGTTLIFDHDFTSANLSIDTAYWDESIYSEYSDISGAFTKINYTYGGMDTWYYKTNIPITANEMYQIRVWQDVKLNTNGKYWFCAKPSSQTIDEAVVAGTFYCLDPWYNASWNYVRQFTGTGNSSVMNDYQAFLNITNTTNMNITGQDIRFTYNDNTTVLSYWIENWSTNNALIGVKTNQSTVNMFYGNPTATSQSNIFNTGVNCSDDFSEASFNTTRWTTTGAQTNTQANGILNHSAIGVVSAIARCGMFNASQVIVTARANLNPNRKTHAFYGESGDFDNATAYAVFQTDTPANGMKVRTGIGASSSEGNYIQTNLSDYQRYKTYWLIGNITGIINDSVRSNLLTNVPSANLQLRFAEYNNSGLYDYIFVRKYMLTEPTFTMGAEQVYVPTILFSSLNSTNSTTAGTDILHSLFWNSSIGLNGYIFSFGNGSNWTQSDQSNNLMSGTTQFKGTSQDTGFLSPSTNGALVTGLTSPTYAYVIESNYATGTIGIASWYGGYNANIPTTSTIRGITLRSIDKASSGTGTNQMIYRLSNNDGSTYASHEYLAGDVSTSDVNHTIGNTTYLWGLSWTPATVNTIKVNATSGATSTRTMSLNWISVNITYSDLDANKSYNTNNMVNNASVLAAITNITFIVNISTYNKSGSTDNSNANPDLWLEMWNGTNWIELGNMSIDGTGNHSNSTQNAGILSAWQTPSNRNVRVKGRYFDSNGNYDNINYTQMWVDIDSTGVLKDDAFVPFTGLTNWSNVTKGVNSTVGATISWCVKVNDTANNWNTTSCNTPFSYLTTSAGDSIPPMITIVSPTNTTYSQNWTWANITLNENGNWCGVSLNGTANQTLSNTSMTSWYLNLTVPIVGANNVKFYCNDTAGNMGNSSTIYFTTTSGANPCACPSINTNWAVDMAQYCVLSSNCDLGTGNLTFTGVGNFTINAILHQKNNISIANNQIVYVQSSGYWNMSG